MNSINSLPTGLKPLKITLFRKISLNYEQIQATVKIKEKFKKLEINLNFHPKIADAVIYFLILENSPDIEIR